ncbi:MAG: zinc ABC transporter substrate-binding protein [Deltaproteobacteria bacterium]|nr:zinc ABC transporter substrate-binding protein [Deltaproteobacteria bacterium]
MIRSAVLGVLVGLVLVASCGSKKEAGTGSGSGGPTPTTAKLKVAVSIFPLYDVTRRIAGDRAEVHLILPPGKSEHGYDPTPQEIAKLDGAKLGVAVGLDMDGWAENVMKSAGDPKVLRIGEKVKTVPIDTKPIEQEESGAHHEGHDHAHEHEHEGEVGAPDPHVWLDPDRMILITQAIAAELTAMDPESKDIYAKNAATLTASLKDLDVKIMTRSKAWTKHTVVTFHGALAYYARRYGVRIGAVVEPIAGKEPTAAYIAEVIEAIKKNKASALFSEPQLDRAPGEVIAREAKIPLGELDPIGGVTGRESYEALLTWNTDQLEAVLK